MKIPAFELKDEEASRRCLRDVVALSTLPAMWYGAEPVRVAESLAAALFTTLRPVFICVVYADAAGGPDVCAAQTGRYVSDPDLCNGLADELLARARTHDPDDVMALDDPAGDGRLSVAVQPIGHMAEVGVIAAAFADGEGPTPVHQLLLRIAATQAALAAQNSSLLSSLREESQTLETLNRMGAVLATEFELEEVVQTVTDAGVTSTGAQFGAFFYTTTDAAGESFMLYTLSGAPRSAFEKLPHPRATAVFAPTFSGEGVVRSADIQADPRFGHNEPYFGMPPGHLPVRSYLAVPVTSRSGQVTGGLFFGHADTGVFNARAERVALGLAGQAAIALDNAGMFRAAQRANQTLEERIAERTVELNTAHEALRQAQKMEAIGRLTGGIAHDFNNLLTVIRGSADLLRRPDLPDSKRRRYIDSIADTADRAARLTGQLLAFARKQALAPEVFDAASRVHEIADMLRAVLGARIGLDIEGAAEPRFVEADPGQFETSLVNLAVNARDAMEGEGRLKITVNPGEGADDSYVAVTVTDTGSGIAGEHLEHIFEPFFTTKQVGKGTGLGLSQVYGFVQQSGGRVEVRSDPGQGAAFTLYLPRGAPAAAAEGSPTRTWDHTGGGRVLVVEDNAEVREFADHLLADLGFETTLAPSSAEALALLEACDGDFDVVFSDVVMPGLSGVEFGKLVLQKWPRLPVVLTSGYSHALAEKSDHGFPLLHKPYSADDLASLLRQTMASAGPAST